MSDFHLKTELPEEGRTERMAEAFEAGLRHFATDPLVRLKMILGETYAAYTAVVVDLRDKLSKEKEPVRKLANQMLDDAFILWREIGDPDCIIFYYC